MAFHAWDLTRIVDPQLVERALADQERRARRRLLRLNSPVPVVKYDNEASRAVAA